MIAGKDVELKDTWFNKETGENQTSTDPNWKQFTELEEDEKWDDGGEQC